MVHVTSLILRTFLAVPRMTAFTVIPSWRIPDDEHAAATNEHPATGVATLRAAIEDLRVVHAALTRVIAATKPTV